MRQILSQNLAGAGWGFFFARGPGESYSDVILRLAMEVS